MSMRRAVAAVVVAVGIAWLSTPPSHAAALAPRPGPAPAARGDHLVCGSAPVGYASCAAHVQTDKRTGRPAVTSWYTTGITPAQLQSVYGPFGTGAPLVAVVDAYASPAAASDLAVYRAQFGLGTAPFTQVDQKGSTSGLRAVTANLGWAQEEMLDLEMVAAVCPQCSILYVGAASPSFADLGAAVQTAARLGAKVISNSYGAAEWKGETAYLQWNVKGVAVTVATGDDGYGAEFPAASSGVIAVGGTTLTLTDAGTRASETVWSGAGSGCSAYIAKPAWQNDKGCAKRTIADVSAVADPGTGVAVYDSYGATAGSDGWYVFGGTSAAAPIVGAIIARDGVAATPAKSLWTARAALYDVASGRNGTCTTRTVTTTAYLCTGAAGYDGPSGNGAPNGRTSPF